MTKVVGIRGGPAPLCGTKPMQDVVSTFEKYLKLARDGQIRGVAFVLYTADDGVVTDWSSGDSDNRMLLSGATTLMYRIAKQYDELENS